MTLFGEKWAFKEFILKFFGTNKNYENISSFYKKQRYYNFHRVGLETTKITITLLVHLPLSIKLCTTKKS